MRKLLNKKHNFFLIIGLVAIIVTLFSSVFGDEYQVKKFHDLKVYSQCTTTDKKYTVVLKDNTELGLFGAIRLNIYLVDNQNGEIKFIGKQRMDYYEDFTPHIEYIETANSVIILFHLKHSDEKLEISL